MPGPAGSAVWHSSAAVDSAEVQWCSEGTAADARLGLARQPCVDGAARLQDETCPLRAQAAMHVAMHEADAWYTASAAVATNLHM